MIKEVCNRLKEKRREQGYSLEYTVEKTKLHPSVIKDIEDCNLDKVSPTYLKGFMKIYASFLGVDLGTSLEELDSLSSLADKPRKVRKVPTTNIFDRLGRIPKKLPSRVKKNIIIAVLGLFCLWVLFSGVKFVGGRIWRLFREKPQGQEASTPAKEEPVAQVPERPTAVKGLTVSLTTKKKCFIKVKVDQNVLFEGILDKGAVETWKGNKEIEFKISDGSAVYLEVNGKSLPPLASLRKPIKSLKITPSGISVDK